MNDIAAQLSAAFDHAKPIARDDLTVAVINYPGFHPTPFMEAWHGFDWDEWTLTCNCKPRFAGHRQPLAPAWGPYDESDPKWAAKETDAAADHGIDVWIYDWYWYCGTEIWNEALNDGFLNAPNRDRMKFGVMWANHTWNDNHPAPAGQPLRPLLPIRHAMEDLDRVVDYWAERYFSQPNYWRIDGKPWCSIFQYRSLAEHLGGDAGVGRAIERMRTRAQRNGEDDLHLGLFTWTADEAQKGIDAGFDHVTTYNVSKGATQQPEQPIVDYTDVMLQHVETWLEMADAGVAYWPVVTHGWDVSARNDPAEPWPPVRWGWPWGHIVTGNTPQRFGELVYAARRFLGARPTAKPGVMVLNAWNEWTEGSVLAPTADEGDAVLQSLHRALAAD